VQFESSIPLLILHRSCPWPASSVLNRHWAAAFSFSFIKHHLLYTIYLAVIFIFQQNFIFSFLLQDN
jgi:hypothetical protein